MKKGAIILAVIALMVGLVGGIACGPSVAAFEVTNLVITPGEACVLETITISADVENVGGAEGTYTATFTVAGEEIYTEDITVAAGEVETVTFDYTWDVAGTYEIEVEELSAELTLTGASLPTSHVGDQWVYNMTSGEDEFTWTEEITGEDVVDGVDCFIAQITYDPEYMGISEMTWYIDKATENPIVMEWSGEFDGNPYTGRMEYSYQFVGEMWPIEVGNEAWYSETMTYLIIVEGEVVYRDESETTGTYIVESIEEVTVPAGTFRCLKMVSYDEEENIISTIWYSDIVKSQVKMVGIQMMDGEVDMTMELTSYSVQ